MNNLPRKYILEFDTYSVKHSVIALFKVSDTRSLILSYVSINIAEIKETGSFCNNFLLVKTFK